MTDGEKCRKQRAMVDPAFSMMRIRHAFSQMQAAVSDHEVEKHTQLLLILAQQDQYPLD